MMQNVLGERTWERGMNYYLSEMALKSANSQDLYRGIQKAIDEEGTGFVDIARVMDSWENQKGYPVVHVSWNKNELTLRQERFLYKKPTNPDKTLWCV
jgi:aminopeptidase N